MSNLDTGDLADLGITLNEYLTLKEATARLSLEKSNLTRECRILGTENMKLRELTDSLQALFEKKLYGQKQHELANAYAEIRQAGYYYNIDVVGACSVRCPSCPVGNASIHPTKGLMDVDTFTKILEKIAADHKGETVSIELYNWGESVLHPKLPEIIRITKGFGFICGLSNNLNTAVNLRGIVRAEPDYMRISVSGFTNQIYQRTHAGGDVNAVKSNLYLLRHYLEKYKNTRTQIEIGYLVYRHNFENDLLAIRDLCDELSFSLNWNYAIMMPVETAIQSAQGNIDASVQEINDLLVVSPQKWSELSKPHRPEHTECAMHATRTVINFDGSVPLCCGTYTPETIIADNFLETTHEEIQARKYSHPLCSKCMENMVDFMFTCITPPEVEEYARSELAQLGTFVGRHGR